MFLTHYLSHSFSTARPIIILISLSIWAMEVFNMSFIAFECYVCSFSDARRLLTDVEGAFLKAAWVAWFGTNAGSMLLKSRD